MSLSNGLKYKIDANLLLNSGNVTELYHQNVQLIDVPGEVPFHPHPLTTVISMLPKFFKYCLKIMKNIK